MAQFISQDSVAAASLRMVTAAERSIDITSGWIRGSALRLLLESVRARLEAGDLAVRIVYRLKEQSDLDITELGALKEFEALGASIRYCRRLHAKMIVVDGQQAVISSSNLTATAGYTFRPAEQDWTNYEAGVLADASDVQLVADARELFERIWDDSHGLSEEVVGAVIGQPGTMEFQFVLLRGVRRTEYVVADCEDGYLLGKVEEINTLNVSFPELDQPAASQNSTGYVRRPLPDLRSIFAGESKEQAFLLTTTFYDPASAFSIATVRVLKQRLGERLRMPLTPTAPGAVVRKASNELLLELEGDGEVVAGVVFNHEAVPVKLKAKELLSKHCAVYGMTGSGKSNGLKVLLRELSAFNDRLGGDDGEREPALAGTRIIVVDTHGEYASARQSIHPESRLIDVEVPETVNILDEQAVKEELRLRAVDGALRELLWTTKEWLEDSGQAADCPGLMSALRGSQPKPGSAGSRLLRAYDRDPARFSCDEPTPVARRAGTDETEDFASQALYVLNLRPVHDARLRSRAAAWVMEQAFQRAKATDGGFPTLFVIDEVQNYAPESGLDDVRPSLDAILRIAREGRKFGVGLIVSSQRPANVSTDLRSQCNSHLIFRLVNGNDLNAIHDSVDAADRNLVENLLPQLDTGTCFVCGTAIENPFFAVVPLFGGEKRGAAPASGRQTAATSVTSNQEETAARS